MLGTVTVACWLTVPPAATAPVAWALPTLFADVPKLAWLVVMRTCEFELAAAPVPLLRTCQLTDSEPPGATLLLPSVTLCGCTSTVAAAAALLNDAVTNLAASMVTVQLLMPLQAPDQPAKFEPPLGVAFSVTTVPRFKAA